MNPTLTYIQNNPLGAALICLLGAFIIATMSALIAGLRGGAGRIFGEYQALGRSLDASQRSRQKQDATYSELHARVAELRDEADQRDSQAKP